MTGLLNILAQIEDAAQQKAEKIESKARDEAQSIVADAKKEAEELLSDYSDKAQQKLKELADRAKAADEIDKKRAELFKKQELIKKVLTAAKDEIKNAENGKYFGFLESILKKYAQNQAGTVVLPEADLKNMTGGFRTLLDEKNLTAKIGEIAKGNGFVIVYGNIEVNCTIDAIFDADDEELSDALNEFLFGSEGGI